MQRKERSSMESIIWSLHEKTNEVASLGHVSSSPRSFGLTGTHYSGLLPRSPVQVQWSRNNQQVCLSIYNYTPREPPLFQEVECIVS